ncbi:unnamed protein product [Polarella glacialis]|uniref:Uncharacterized protein n=1 Tax=Polarella glacialis TaxID=89957 RepID=A0A813L1U5_POLGL|nr:unnamed protein product [Polarella glacialis]
MAAILATRPPMSQGSTALSRSERRSLVRDDALSRSSTPSASPLLLFSTDAPHRVSCDLVISLPRWSEHLPKTPVGAPPGLESIAPSLKPLATSKAWAKPPGLNLAVMTPPGLAPQLRSLNPDADEFVLTRLAFVPTPVSSAASTADGEEWEEASQQSISSLSARREPSKIMQDASRRTRAQDQPLLPSLLSSRPRHSVGLGEQKQKMPLNSVLRAGLASEPPSWTPLVQSR